MTKRGTGALEATHCCFCLPLHDIIAFFVAATSARLSMVYRQISHDLKMASVRLRHRCLDTVKDIQDITGISVPTLYRSWDLHARTGSFVKARLLALGRRRKVYHRDA